jgi:hypothetical protein
MAVLAIQTVLPSDEIDVGTALVIFFKYLGGTLFIAIGQTLFLSRLQAAVVQHAPGVSFDAVLAAGATDLVHSFLSPYYQGVLQAYNEATTQTFVSSEKPVPFDTRIRGLC